MKKLGIVGIGGGCGIMRQHDYSCQPGTRDSSRIVQLNYSKQDIDEAYEKLKISAVESCNAFKDLELVSSKMKHLPNPFRKFKEPKRNFTKKFNKNSHRI